MSQSAESLFYESNRYNDRHACRECRSTAVYTRIYFHEVKLDSCYLCYYCATNEDKYREYKLLTVDVTYSKEKKE